MLSCAAATMVVLLGAAVFGLGQPSAGAQSELDTARANARVAAEAADEARAAARAARVRADEAVGELERAVGGLETLEARITIVELNAADAFAERDSLLGSVQELAVRRYVANDQRSPAEITAVSPQEQARASTLFRFALLGGGEEVDRFRVVDQEYAFAVDELTDLRVEQQAAIDELAVRNEALAVELAEMERQLGIAEEREAEFQREVARLEEEERRRLEEERRRRLAEQRRIAAEEAAERAREEARRTNAPIITGTDGFLCPIGGATSFSDTWGAPRSGGRSHRGVDMFAAKGTPVVASVGGEVRHRNSSLGGKSYYLDGDDGNRYYGAHLDSFGASGRVEAGTVVGTVGNTGNARASSPHLHFEIHPGGGSAVNPTATVRNACG
jgi:peptidoglycan LD-endopeptidase LytH